MALQTGEFAPIPTHRITVCLLLLLLLPLLPFNAGCATVPLQQTGSLSSYELLQPADGMLTKARVSVDKDTVLTARTVRIVPTTFSPTAASAKLSERDRRLVANAVDR